MFVCPFDMYSFAFVDVVNLVYSLFLLASKLQTELECSDVPYPRTRMLFPLKITRSTFSIFSYHTFWDLAGSNINCGEYQRMTPYKFWAGFGRFNVFVQFFGGICISSPLLTGFRPVPEKKSKFHLKIHKKNF